MLGGFQRIIREPCTTDLAKQTSCIIEYLYAAAGRGELTAVQWSFIDLWVMR